MFRIQCPLSDCVLFFAELQNLTLTGKGNNVTEDGNIAVETGAKVSFTASLAKAYQPNIAYRWGLWNNVMINFLVRTIWNTFSQDTTFDKRLIDNFFILLGVLLRTSACNFFGFHLECKRDESPCGKTWDIIYVNCHVKFTLLHLGFGLTCPLMGLAIYNKRCFCQASHLLNCGKRMSTSWILVKKYIVTNIVGESWTMLWRTCRKVINMSSCCFVIRWFFGDGQGAKGTGIKFATQQHVYSK